LQQAWQWHAERLRALQPECVQADRRAAYAAFLAAPSPETEQRLAVLADERLTARRYSLLSEAHSERLHRLRLQAIETVMPVLEQARHALAAQLSASAVLDGGEAAEAGGQNASLEIQRQLEAVDLALEQLQQMVHTPPLDPDWSPSVLAGLLESATPPPSAQSESPRKRSANPVAQR
jgi:hypothetical protein